MTDSELDLFKVQVGKQSAFDTAVAQTAKLMAIESCEINPLVPAESVPELRGDLTPNYYSHVMQAGGEASMAGVATYEDLAYFFDGLFGEATPAGADPYTYDHSGAGAKPTPRILTLTKGSSEGVYALVGALANTFELSVEPHGFAKFSAGFIGHSVETDTLDSLSDRSYNAIHGNHLTLYIDDFGTAAGTTEYTGVKCGLTLSLDMNRAPKEGLGSINPESWKQRRGEPGSNTLSLTLEYDSTAGLSKTMFDALIAATSTPLQKVVRLDFTLDVNHKLVLDFAGFAPEAPQLWSDDDGIATLQFVLNAQYEATLTNWFDSTITNQVATLP